MFQLGRGSSYNIYVALKSSQESLFCLWNNFPLIKWNLDTLNKSVHLLNWLLDRDLQVNIYIYMLFTDPIIYIYYGIQSFCSFWSTQIHMKRSSLVFEYLWWFDIIEWGIFNKTSYAIKIYKIEKSSVSYGNFNNKLMKISIRHNLGFIFNWSSFIWSNHF